MWQFVAVDEDGTALGELRDAKSRKITWRLSAPCEAEFSISGNSTQATFADELINDIVIYRGSSKLFRGRIVTSGDTLTPDSHEVKVGVVDYRGLLHRQILNESSTAIVSGYTATDQSAIAWDLINDFQATIGAAWGITQGVGTTTGVNRTRSSGYYTAGKNLGEAVEELSNVINGFDYEIDANLKLNVYYPFRGDTTADFAVTYDVSGGNVVALERSVDTTDYANVIRVSGNDGVTPAVVFSGDIATRPEGRFSQNYADTDLRTSTAVTETAQRLLADRSDLQPSYTCTLSADSGWDPTKLWVGDTCPIRINRGRLDVTTTGRVVEIAVSIDENDAETVSIVFDRPRIKDRLIRDLRSVINRVEGLERR